jgi:predicted dithiol-disulfide oxidoreductase (DUF899 family)
MNTQTTENQADLRNKVVTRDEWLIARKAHLSKEKELTRKLDQLREERRTLPWVKVEKNYVFEGSLGRQTLADLFKGRSQLIVQHFMFAPEWEEGCVGCSFGADHANVARKHFENNDVSFVAISRAPYPKIQAFKKRMGWDFNWVSSFESDFNFDYNVSFKEEQIHQGKVYYNFTEQDFHCEELSGTSVFYKNEAGEIFHTYSTYARGDEMILSTYMYLDITPKGRNELGPNGNLTDWVRHHDKYQDKGYVDSRGIYQNGEANSSCGCGMGEA